MSLYHPAEPINAQAHNEEVRRVTRAFEAGTPYRVPVMVTGSITNFLLNPDLNVRGWTFRDFFENPETQVKAQLEYQKWQRFHLVCDREMGLPDNGWPLSVDFQNSYDAGWIGCPLKYLDGQVPDTEPILRDHKERLYSLPENPGIRHGLMGRAFEFYEYMLDACGRMEYEGRPLLPPDRMPGEGTDGPLGLAYKLRGADNLFLDMLTDEKYYHDLMTYVTDNLVRRIKQLRELRWSRFPDSPDKGVYRQKGYGFADDAIALISAEHYREFVFPYHKKMFDQFSDGSPCSIHLCGDATRHFRFLRDKLNVMTFDTGFPVDHGRLRKELGPDVLIKGGPTVMLLKSGSREDIVAEVKRICESGVMEGGKFIMIAANNMAPCTPVENVRALYEATKMYGRYPAEGPR
jgi:uroporphyrinogen-III decarboxylase